jgi:hypothetical protein
MKNLKCTQRLVSSIPWARNGCPHFAFFIFHFSFFITHFLALGTTKRSHFAAFRRRPFGVSADLTLGVLGLTKVRLAQIGKLFPDNS